MTCRPNKNIYQKSCRQNHILVACDMYHWTVTCVKICATSLIIMIIFRPTFKKVCCPLHNPQKVCRGGVKNSFWIIKNFPMILKPSCRYLTKFFIIKRDDRHLCFYTSWTRETEIRSNFNNLLDKWLRKKVVTDNLLKIFFFSGGIFVNWRVSGNKQFLWLALFRKLYHFLVSGYTMIVKYR